MMTFCLIASAWAADLPSIDKSIDTGTRSKRDAIVVLGVEDYHHLEDVPYALADASAADSWLRETWGPSKSRTTVAMDPSNRAMQDAVDRAMARVKKGGTLWITFSGQGRIVDGVPRLLGADSKLEDPKAGISLIALQEAAARSRAEKVFILIDASFDGSARSELAPTPPKAIDWGDDPYDKVVLWVGDERGGARGFEPSGHGLFTYLALGALQGWGDMDGDGLVRLDEAQLWVRESSRALGRTQRSTVSTELQDWVVSGKRVRADGPKTEDLLAWGKEDLNRRVALAEREAQDAAEDALLSLLAAIESGQMPPESLERFVDQWSQHRVSVEWIPPMSVVEEAKLLLADKENLLRQGSPDGEEGPDVAELQTTEPPKSSLSDDTCKDIVAMEPDALMGRFSPGRIACIEKRMLKSPQTEQDKLSRLLIANAEASGDKDQWALLVERHLLDITQSDPDLCFLFALHLYKQGVEEGEQAIMWANRALENKQNWKGELYKARVSSLYRLRTEAAAELWQDAEQNLVADPSAKADALTAKWRGVTLDYAREWLDYTKAAGAPSDRALSLCVSAAGSMSACTAD